MVKEIEQSLATEPLLAVREPLLGYYSRQKNKCTYILIIESVAVLQEDQDRRSEPEAVATDWGDRRVHEQCAEEAG